MVSNGRIAFDYLKGIERSGGSLVKCGSDMYAIDEMFINGICLWDFFASFEEIKSTSDINDTFSYFLGSSTPETAVCIVVHIPNEIELVSDNLVDKYHTISIMKNGEEYIPSHFIVGAGKIKNRKDYWAVSEELDNLEFYRNPNYIGNLPVKKQYEIVNGVLKGDHYGKSI